MKSGQAGITEGYRRLPGLRLDGQVVINYNHLSQPMTALPVTSVTW